MKQYLSIKAGHPDGIVFFRCGDFYEMFFEDAVIASQKLDITLTSRDKGKDDAVPMCGFPYHAARSYIAKLNSMGLTVVLAEQVEDPKKAKGLVKREVVRIITPGVVVDDDVLEPKVARYVAAIGAVRSTDGPAGSAKLPAKKSGRSTKRGNKASTKSKAAESFPTKADVRYGLAYLDVSTGEFRCTQLDSLDDLIGELVRVEPREVLVADGLLADGGLLVDVPKRYRGAVFNRADPFSLSDACDLLDNELPGDVARLGLSAKAQAACAAAEVLNYARETQPTGVLPVSRLQVYEPAQMVVLDEAAVANLELCGTLMGGKKQGSLLSIIDKTKTAPGGRMLRRWLLYPLVELAPIRRRQDCIAYWIDYSVLREQVREQLKHVYDLERLASRVSLNVATPRDLGRLRDSLAQLPTLAALVRGQGESTPLAVPELIEPDDATLAQLAKLHAELDHALVDEPPAITKDGGIIRDGHCSTVDENRGLAAGGKATIEQIEQRERERTGIPNLKIKYNRVFGYYIEVTRTHLSRVPDDYVRKQTVATGERFVTSELAALEAKILAAQETLISREVELFQSLCTFAATYTQALAVAAELVANVDCTTGLAELAHTNEYCRPDVNDEAVIQITEGRHPVVEQMVAVGSFIPNDCRLDPDAEQILLITGPNMAGKSTYMRQVAQIVLLAQMGSFVPASAATIGVVDRIFTRVGAADNLARGESTFMVEMRETSAIMATATKRSLVVLDEVGRGTSTFDGVSIAWAVTEYLHDAIGARTLFATHYHELCALARSRSRVRNLSVAVREHNNEIIFLRQIIEGGASRSYGIDVARLAGLPRSVVSRARQILGQLEGKRDLAQSNQLALFDAASAPPPLPEGAVPPNNHDEIASRLRDVDPHRTTPLEALMLLAELTELV